MPRQARLINRKLTKRRERKGKFRLVVFGFKLSSLGANYLHLIMFSTRLGTWTTCKTNLVKLLLTIQRSRRGKTSKWPFVVFKISVVLSEQKYAYLHAVERVEIQYNFCLWSCRIKFVDYFISFGNPHLVGVIYIKYVMSSSELENCGAFSRLLILDYYDLDTDQIWSKLLESAIKKRKC